MSLYYCSSGLVHRQNRLNPQDTTDFNRFPFNNSSQETVAGLFNKCNKKSAHASKAIAKMPSISARKWCLTWILPVCRSTVLILSPDDQLTNAILFVMKAYACEGQ